MNRRQRFILSIGTLIFALLLAGLATWGSLRRTEADIDRAFLEAIDRHYRDRMYYLSYARPEALPWDIIQDMLMPADAARAVRYAIRQGRGHLVINLPQGVKGPRQKRLLNEYVLSLACPVKATELDALFRQALKRKGISGRSGVVCQVQSKLHYSADSTQQPRRAYATPRYTLDIAKTVKVQAWMDYGASAVISHLSPLARVFVPLSLFCALGLILYPALVPGCRKLLPQVLPAQGIDIDFDKQSLRIDGSPCTIQKLDLALLDILHRNMGQCVAREQIKQAFWPTDDNANEKIDTHIKTIRKVLRDFPRYRLVTVRGKGYYLECTPQQA